MNAVVTGGSSGIGLAVARELARRGATLHLIARDRAKLETARRLVEQESKTPVAVHSADVSDEGAITSVLQSIGAASGIDILIVSAGIMRVGRFADMAPGEHEESLAVNYRGALYTVRAAWPYLLQSRGHLGLVSSVAGYTGLYGYTAYAPAKFAIAGLAECLRMEARPHGIGVTVVYPPDTDTPLLAYEREHAPPETRAITAGARTLSPEAVAQAFVRGLLAGKFEVYCNGESRLIRIVKALAPGIYYRILDRMADKAGR